MSTKTERCQQIEKLQREFVEARGIYLTDIDRISVAKITQLRAELRKNGLKYIVVKNSLARIALERTGKDGIAHFLTGKVGVVVAKGEATVPARVIRDFHKDNRDLLKLKAAIVEGTVFDGAQAERLADIPSREVLLSQLLSCLQAPMSRFVGALSGILGNLVGILQAVKEQKEKEPAQQ